MIKPTKNWLKSGLLFGLLIYIMGITNFPFFNGKEITYKKILIGIPICLITGLAWGYLMKIWISKKGR